MSRRIWSAFGLPVERFTKAGLLTAYWSVDGILPFMMLISLSLVTAPRRRRTHQAVATRMYATAAIGGPSGGTIAIADGETGQGSDPIDDDQIRIDRSYACLKTPVGVTTDDDQAEVELSNANPQRFDHLKLCPRSNWEFTRWTKSDVIGFFAAVGLHWQYSACCGWCCTLTYDSSMKFVQLCGGSIRSLAKSFRSHTILFNNDYRTLLS